MPIVTLIIGFLGLIGTVLTLDDGLDFVIDTCEAIFHDARYGVKFAVNRIRRYGRMVFYIALALLILYALCVIGLIGALIGHWTIAVIGLSIALAVIAALFFSVLNWITVVTKRAGPSVWATVTLMPLPLAFWAATTPFHFYEWLLAAYGLFMIVGFAFIILGRLVRSKVFLGPYAITCILVVSAILTALIFAFPQQARTIVIDWKISSRDKGREALAKEISLRTEDSFKSDAPWWYVTTDSEGKIKQTRYRDVNGKQCISAKNEKFKTVLAPADSAENGSTYIQAYFADSKTKEYVFLDIEDRIEVKTIDPKDQTINMGTEENPCVVKTQDENGYDKKLEDLLPWVDASKTTSTAKVFTETDVKNAVSTNTANSNGSCVVTYSSGSCWTITPPNTRGAISEPNDSKFTSSKVEISEDGNSCRVIVPAADVSEVSTAGFTLKSGESFTIDVEEGSVLFSNEHPRASASGLYGWRDPNVQGEHKDEVGGLEFGIGSFTGSKVVGNHYTGTADKSGVTVWRVVESARGRKDGNKGGYIVTIKKS